MTINQQPVKANGIKFFIIEDGVEVARAFLYLLKNELHPEPYGLPEDVFVKESHRRMGIAAQLVKAIIAEAEHQKCYKLILNCTEDLVNYYHNLGFKDWVVAMRMDFHKA